MKKQKLHYTEKEIEAHLIHACMNNDDAKTMAQILSQYPFVILKQIKKQIGVIANGKEV